MPHRIPDEVYERTKQFRRSMDILAWVFGVAAAVMAVVIIFTPVQAEAHEGHHVTNSQYGLPMTTYKERGRLEEAGVNRWLYGMLRNSNLTVGNCCKEGNGGDCRAIPAEQVSVVPGGYMWDGEFIPEAETTISPDDNFYGCKHPNTERAHCFFAPPMGF